MILTSTKGFCHTAARRDKLERTMLLVVAGVVGLALLCAIAAGVFISDPKYIATEALKASLQIIVVVVLGRL